MWSRACVVVAFACLGCRAEPVVREAAEERAPGPARQAAPAARELFTPDELARILRLSPLPRPPDDPTNAYDLDSRAARVGQTLFFDRRLSASGTISCATCHEPQLAFSDGLSIARGLQDFPRNTPGLWNVAHQRWFFWDGRADSLWSQALHPLEDSREHGSSRLAIAHVLFDDPRLRRAYEDVFGPLPPLDDGARFPAQGRPMVPADASAPRSVATAPDPRLGGAADRSPVVVLGTAERDPEGDSNALSLVQAWAAMLAEDRAAVDRVFANVGKAIAAYVRRLESRRSPFDRFVEGLSDGDSAKLAALSESARVGLRLFVGEARCHLCHGGPLLSDGEFHDTGLPWSDGQPDEARKRGIELVREDPFNARGTHSDAREGTARDKLDFLPQHAHGVGEFKTPSLRNVALTAPYFHDGRLRTLEEVVRFYSTREGARTNPPPTERILTPLDLSDEEVDSLIAFLHALSDQELDPALLGPPPSLASD